jgi:hypothetical protein
MKDRTDALRACPAEMRRELPPDGERYMRRSGSAQGAILQEVFSSVLALQ